MPGGETILVVEDAEEIRRLVCGMLSLQGYKCISAMDGLEALQLLECQTEPVDLMLTDLVMPNMAGAELARRVARLRPEIRIVLMSGFSEDPVVRTFEHAPTAFIAKPFTVATLCAKVREALDEPWTGFPDPQD
ncbi:MAG TPA: response regulator [Bryobacteraceae bacterium]|nr:response regulator [Bryobacteraceae bacterium]